MFVHEHVNFLVILVKGKKTKTKLKGPPSEIAFHEKGYFS